jgi:hypothetical protein
MGQRPLELVRAAAGVEAELRAVQAAERARFERTLEEALAAKVMPRLVAGLVDRLKVTLGTDGGAELVVELAREPTEQERAALEPVVTEALADLEAEIRARSEASRRGPC